MASFAKIGLNNKVIEVLSVNNEVLKDSNGVEQENIGIDFLTKLTGYPLWVQTSYNKNFRKEYAGIGCSYLPEEDVFILPKPFPSWSLNSNFDWKAPIAYPTVLTYGDNAPYWGTYWEESNQRWLTFDDQNNKFAWLPETSSWISTGE